MLQGNPYFQGYPATIQQGKIKNDAQAEQERLKNSTNQAIKGLENMTKK